MRTFVDRRSQTKASGLYDGLRGEGAIRRRASSTGGFEEEFSCKRRVYATVPSAAINSA